MPLFMDLHKASDYEVKPTVDEIKKNHIADLAVQHKYGVRFLQYWINEEAGLVFCMMEAPDKESCAAVHREAHGAMPCNVIELSGGNYNAYLAEGVTTNKFDIVEKPDGTMDPGHRILVALDVLSLKSSSQYHALIHTLATQFGGTPVNRPDERSILLFTNVHSASAFAMKLIQDDEPRDQDVEIRIGITLGDPVTMNAAFFGDAIHHACRLCDIAANKQVVVSHLVKYVPQATETNESLNAAFRMLDPADERFMNDLMDAIQPLLVEEHCSVEALSKKLGMSKSRLYRNIQHLTRSSGNDFLHELRMQKAFRLIQLKYGNVAQISLETGYNNPSYFSKTFRKRFGHSPFSALKT